MLNTVYDPLSHAEVRQHMGGRQDRGPLRAFFILVGRWQREQNWISRSDPQNKWNWEKLPSKVHIFRKLLAIGEGEDLGPVPKQSLWQSYPLWTVETNLLPGDPTLTHIKWKLCKYVRVKNIFLKVADIHNNKTIKWHMYQNTISLRRSTEVLTVLN